MFEYQLPTTGAISFIDICVDQSSSAIHTGHLSEATQARANLRGALKDNRRNNDEDFLKLVKILDEYLPQLSGIIDCVAHDELGFKTDPVFSWRTILSNNVFTSSSRLNVPRIHSDYAFSLLTYAFALSNLAGSIVASLGAYEHERAISDSERKSKDERLNHAITFLCRASGIFSYVGEVVLLQWEKNNEGPQNFIRPPELTREVINALTKLALADAQSLAIRKLLSKSVYDSNIAPGPPLPKSHPSPGLLAKLHLECASLYSSARTLVKTNASVKNDSNSAVSADLRHYLGDESAFHGALGKKWLGIDAGENGQGQKAGDAIGFLTWAKKELEELRDGGKGLGFVKGEKEKAGRNVRKGKVAGELASTAAWLAHSKKMNDTVHFQPVPVQQDLQSRIPTGRLAVSIKVYVPSVPAFGPGSMERLGRQAEDISLSTPTTSYAGAGSYF